ncbi:MAG: hypothetical protein MJY66_07510 [Bacteroidaceae bacterium]|nr:hypothetical protein [Bacteroidaceae bacterium]
MKKILFLLLIIFSLNSCEFFRLIDYFINREQTFIKIVNNSEDTITEYSYSFLPISGGATYPDTLLPPDDLKKYVHKPSILPHSCTYIEVSEKSELIERFGSDSLMIFIFSTDTLNTYSWEEIRSGYKILRRFDFNVHDLDSLEWTLTYP